LPEIPLLHSSLTQRDLAQKTLSQGGLLSSCPESKVSPPLPSFS